MITKDFNQNDDIDQETCDNISDNPKVATVEEPEIMTADNIIYDSTTIYYFFDTHIKEVRDTRGMTRLGERLCSFGLPIIAIAKLCANPLEALADGQNYVKSKTNPMEQNKPFGTICQKCHKIHTRCAGHPKRKNTGGAYRPCNKYPMKGKKVCERCGGKTPVGMASPHFKDGKHSKHQYLPPNFSSRLETVIGDEIENIEHSIEIQKVLETTFLEKLGTGESTEAWQKLKQAVKDYQQAQENPNPVISGLKTARAFGQISSIVEEGLNQSHLYRDIQNIQESQRRLSETLSKVRKEMQQTYTHEQWNEMLSTLLLVLHNNIQDPLVLQAIQQELNSRANSSQQTSKLLTNGR